MKKADSLRSVSAGIVFFAILCVISKTVKITLCPIKRWLGFDCFGCGLTRAFMCALQGDFVKAVQYNVLVVPLSIVGVTYIFLLVLDIFLGTEYLEKAKLFLKNKYVYLVYICVFALSVYFNYILRM